MSFAWNGPSISYSDSLIKEAIDNMHGAGQWHFFCESSARYLKLYKVSEAVDSLLNKNQNSFSKVLDYLTDIYDYYSVCYVDLSLI